MIGQIGHDNIMVDWWTNDDCKLPQKSGPVLVAGMQFLHTSKYLCNYAGAALSKFSWE